MMTWMHSNWGLRAQGLALVIVVFVVGALVGGASERIRAVQTEPQRPARKIGEVPQHLEQLGLTDDQRAAIRQIIEKARPTTDSLMREMMPRVREVRDSVHAEVRRVLTPEQAAELDRIMEEWPPRPERPGGKGPFPGTRRFPAETLPDPTKPHGNDSGRAGTLAIGGAVFCQPRALASVPV